MFLLVFWDKNYDPTITSPQFSYLIEFLCFRGTLSRQTHKGSIRDVGVIW